MPLVPTASTLMSAQVTTTSPTQDLIISGFIFPGFSNNRLKKNKRITSDLRPWAGTGLAYCGHNATCHNTVNVSPDSSHLKAIKLISLLGRQLLLHLPLRLRKLPGFPVFFNCGTDPYGGLSFREGQGALTLTNAHYRKG